MEVEEEGRVRVFAVAVGSEAGLRALFLSSFFLRF